MRYNFFLSFSLGLILSIPPQPCTSMEDPMGNKSTTRPNQMSPMDFCSSASSLYLRACSMPDTLEKGDAFEKVGTLVVTALSALDTSVDLTFRLVLCQLRAKSLQQQGALLHNLSVSNKQPKNQSDVSFELMRKSISCLSSSHEIYKNTKEQSPKNDPNLQSTVKDYESICRDYADSLETFATLCALRAENRLHETEVIPLYTESLDAKSLSDVIFPTKVAKVDLIHLQLLALHKMMRICFTTAQNFDVLCHTEPSERVCKQLIQNADLTKNLLDFMKKYILNSGIDFSVVDLNKSTDTKKSRKNKASKKMDGNPSLVSSPLSGLLKKLPATMDPQAFIFLPWSIYCGSLTKASSILSELPCIPQLKESFVKKSASYKMEAVQAYKEKIYKGEFSHKSELEEAYITACLDDIIGKPELLKAFYKRLHQDRKEARRQAMALRIKESLRQNEAEEAKKKLQLAEEQRLKEERKAAKLALMRDVSPSPDTTTDAPCDVVSTETPLLKPKEKTKGVANLQGRKDQKLEVPKNTSRKKVPDEDVKVIITLSPGNFHTLQCLTGGCIDRNITLDQVIYLLEKGLGCAITPGKGSHRKATASNGKMWTIPSAWDGPIPPHYRLQLNHFLQADLEIDPEDVEEKKV